MPARYRGRIWINGTYWLGAILGTLASFLLLNSLRSAEGWRVAFLCGPALAFVILIVRRNLPESPRWLIAHGRVQEAEEMMRRIEEIARRDGQDLEPGKRRHRRQAGEAVWVPDAAGGGVPPVPAAGGPRGDADDHPVVLYNAIFFTYALVPTRFYGVSNDAVPLYGLAFAVGNLAGPLLLGHLFDSLGRKKMIPGTYLLSRTLLAFSAWLFDAGVLHAAGQTFIWIVFFFTSAGRAPATSRSARSSRSRSGPRRWRSSSQSPRSSARSGRRSTAC